MDTCEIKSPEAPQQGTPCTSMSRKKLGIFFIESEDRRMALGRGYTRGSTPVNIHGKSIEDLSKTGGWIAAFFIFGMYILHTVISILRYVYVGMSFIS
jgi:solute carrier family 15 (peptide/histidine transporter), member 3/4